MHSLFVAVLQQKNLSKAGDLFSLEDDHVINDLPQILSIIQKIITKSDFLTNYNDQSLVEICITRLTSAIRETQSIELNAKPLVELLQTCLSYNLRPVLGGLDPPHAKIASDIMSCIFLNYSKKNVMQLALPVSVKFLHKGNKDLSRNMASYLSLAAIENAKLLGLHTQPIIDSVISGNYSLSRVLPQIYSVNPDPVKSHVMTLVSILASCENAEKLALLSLFASVAKDNAALLEPSIPQLCEGLTNSATAAATLQVLFYMALTRPSPLADHTDHLVSTATNFPKTTLLCIQVMSTIAKTRQEKAANALEFILSAVGRLEVEKHPLALKEVVALTMKYPFLLTANLINRVANLVDEGGGVTNPATRTCILELKSEFHHRSRERLEKFNSSAAAAAAVAAAGVTVVKVNGSRTELNNRVNVHSNAAAPDVTGRIPIQHRSMTQFNVFGGVANKPIRNSGAASLDPPRPALTKSMTRLNSAINGSNAVSSSSSSQQNIYLHSRLSAINSCGAVNAGSPAKSTTCVNNVIIGRSPASSGMHQPRANAAAFTSNGSVSMGGGAHGGSLSVVGGNPSLVTPSSYSAEGLLGGREVLTVNVNQINADLIRQVSSVLSHHDISGLMLQQQQPNRQATAATAEVMSSSFSSNVNVVSSSVARRVPPCNSGPLTVPTPPSFSQPPSLGIPSHSIQTSSHANAARTLPTSNVPVPTAGTSGASVSKFRLEKTSETCNRGGGFSNTLPGPRRRKEIIEETECGPRHPTASEDDLDKVTAAGLKSRTSSGVELRQQTSGPLPKNRMSVFEPYPMRDTVQHFCEKHLNKIKNYMESLSVKLPLPVKCTIEERKGRKHSKLHFGCQGRYGEHCLYKSTFYSLKTRNPRTWIHLMFLALQSRSVSAVSTRETSVSALKNCWEILRCENISFVTLVTGAFPPAKAQDNLLHELRSHRFFDVFEYNAIETHWGCFLCNYPDRAPNFVQEQVPLIEGELKERKGGKWKMFKKWKSRYFTLSGAKLSYKDEPDDEGQCSNFTHLDVGSIRSVKVSKEGRRNIPKAFEIFTADKTFVLKAKDGSNAQEWVQCLSVAKAHSQARDSNLRTTVPYGGGSLGRLNQQGRARTPTHHRSATLDNQRFKTAAAAI